MTESRSIPAPGVEDAATRARLLFTRQLVRAGYDESEARELAQGHVLTTPDGDVHSTRMNRLLDMFGAAVLPDLAVEEARGARGAEEARRRFSQPDLQDAQTEASTESVTGQGGSEEARRRYKQREPQQKPPETEYRSDEARRRFGGSVT